MIPRPLIIAANANNSPKLKCPTIYVPIAMIKMTNAIFSASVAPHSWLA